jgi:hypothetical protein
VEVPLYFEAAFDAASKIRNIIPLTVREREMPSE